jgi:outer membrane protein
MNNKTSIVLLLAIIFMSFNVQAQKKWTLEECINYALQHNIDLKQSKLQLDIQETNLLRSKAAMLPTLNANANDIVNWGKTVDRYTNQFADSRTTSINLYLQSSVTVFNGFRLLNSVKKNKLELVAQQYDLNYQQDMKSMEITTAFLQILYDQENLKNKTEQVKLTSMQVERTQKLYDAGSVAKGDLYNIKSQLATEQATFIDAENKLNLSLLKLKQLMYLPGDTTIEIYAPEIELTDGFYQIEDPYKVYDYALKNRPEIKSAEIRVESSMKDLSIAKGGISPTLSLSAGLGSGYSGANSILDGTPVFTGFVPSGDFTTAGDTVISPTFQFNTKPKNWDDQFLDNKNYSIGLYLSIPIFNGLQNYTNISQSKIAMQQAELQLEKSKREMRQTIEQAYADARSAFKQYQAAKIQVDALTESFDYASQRYDAKMITAFEYNDAKIKLDIAKSDMINAKYNYVFRVKVLDFYYGKPLTL